MKDEIITCKVCNKKRKHFIVGVDGVCLVCNEVETYVGSYRKKLQDNSKFVMYVLCLSCNKSSGISYHARREFRDRHNESCWKKVKK